MLREAAPTVPQASRVPLPAPDQALLAAVQTKRAAEDAELAYVRSLVYWADVHDTTRVEDGCLYSEDGHLIPLAGEGAPMVDDRAMCDLAPALGLSWDACRTKVGRAVELAHRLPRTFERMCRGEVPVWRAERIAAATISLGREAAAHVDAEVAPRAHRVGPITLDRLVTEALSRFDPVRAEEKRLHATERRNVTVDHHARVPDFSLSGAIGDPGVLHGLSELYGWLEHRDALDLDRALTRLASQLGDLGIDQPLEVRRSLALGEMARAALSLDLTAPDPAATMTPGQVGTPVTVHLAAGDSVARVVETGSSILATQLDEWIATSAKVVIKVVGDLDVVDPVPGYAIPARHHEVVELRNPTCVFPYCDRPSAGCDTDHITPWPHGPTCPRNLAPLCRRHHRAKTHGRFSYHRADNIPGGHTYDWDTPSGRYRVAPQGTTPLAP